jgi:tRNA dimethylallyltransferase
LKERVLILGGPTASGKNDVAYAIASEFSCEIINADSRQLYSELVIGTNRPSIEDQKKAAHHLFGILHPSTRISSAEYERLALPLVHEIRGRKKVPIVVGGTGFYLKALLRGSWKVPPAVAEFRSRLREIEKTQGRLHLHKMLKRIDPASAAEISPNDAYRVIRALEIFFQSGEKRSQFTSPDPERFVAAKFYVNRNREDLKERIRRRTAALLEQGWVEEVQSLRTRYPDFETFPAARSLGYPEVIRYLKREITMEICREQIIAKTLQYAKRQLTWFRNQDGYLPVDPEYDFKKILDAAKDIASK